MATVLGFDPVLKLKCTCKHCSAIIEYVKKEVLIHKYTDYDGSGNADKYITCPNCYEKVYV